MPINLVFQSASGRATEGAGGGGGGGGGRRTGDGSDANKLVFKSQLVENSVDITQTASLQN